VTQRSRFACLTGSACHARSNRANKPGTLQKPKPVARTASSGTTAARLRRASRRRWRGDRIRGESRSARPVSRGGPAACGTGWRSLLLHRRRGADLFRRERRGRSCRASEKLRTLARAYGPFPHVPHEGENSVTLTSASGDRSAAVATSLRTWCVVAIALRTWCGASQIRGLAWRSEPAPVDRARRAVATRLPGGAGAPRGPRTRRHRHTRQYSERGGRRPVATLTGRVRSFRLARRRLSWFGWTDGRRASRQSGGRFPDGMFDPGDVQVTSL